MLIEWDVRNEIDSAIMERMQTAADLCLKCENVTIPCAVTVCLCDDAMIADINRQYRGIDRSTDVLSFPSVNYPEGKTAGESEALLRQAQEALSAFGGRYEAKIAGHTSIDVTVKGYDKKTMLREIMKKHGLKAEDIVYVGNETEKGAEANIRELGVKTLQVDDIYECRALLKALHSRIRPE